MAELRIELFGSPSLSLNGQPAPISRNKSMALCAYLALHKGACRRDALAALFWPELGQARARADLRRELAHLREVLGPAWLETDRDTVALHRAPGLSVDVLAFREMLTTVKSSGVDREMAADGALSRLTNLVTLYRGDFLDGFTLRDAPEFDAWQYFTAEELRQQLAWVLDTLFAVHRARNDLESAREMARRRLALDPLDEATHQALIELDLHAGNRSAALRQYEQCVRLLQQELDAPPGPALQSLGETIRRFAPAGVYAPATKPLPAMPQPMPSDDEAENRAVVALSLSILPADATGDGAILDRIIAGDLETFLAGCQDRLQRAGATVVYSSAESILALFGLPISSEDDAERCLHCAFELCDAAPTDLTVAAGVASGLAYVKPGGMSSRGTVIGPVLNLAADLQRAAGAGELLVDRAVHLLTSGAVRYSEVETVTVHGRTIAFHRALQRRMVAEKSRGLTGVRAPLIGREQELARLQAALHKAVLGEGQVVFLSGEAGLGKSRLVAELKAQAAGVRWLTGRCRESTASVSYWPFTEIVRLYLGWRPGADESTRTAAIERGLAELIGDGVLAPDSAEEIAAVLGALFDVHFGDRRDDLLRYADPGQMRHRTLVALSTLLLAICKDTQRPRHGANDPGNDESALRRAGGALVLVLEDLHWADALSLDLIRDLLSKVVGAPLLLLCVYRPEAREDCVRLPALAARRAPGATVEIRLHELAREETAQLVDAFFGRHRLPDDLFGWILERAQGNPFFVEETVRSLIDAGAIECENGVWRIARHVRRWDGAQRADTTPGIDSLILSRVGRLDPALRRVLQTASVVGMNFEHPLLADLLPEMTALTDQLHDLEQRDFLLCERMAPLPEYSFRHVLLREAIYKTLPAPRRVHLHWQAAQAIEAHFAADIEAQVEQLAHHYLQTDDHAAAVRYLVRAGARARQAFLNEQARTFFELALQRCAMLGGGGPDAEHLALQADIWQQLGRVKYATGAFAEAERAFRAAMALGETAWDAHTLVRSVYWLGEVLFWQGKFEAMAESVGAAVDRLGPDDRSIEKALMYGHQFAAACMLGRDEEALDTLMQTASLVEGLPFCEELSSAYHHVVEYLFFDEKDVSAANHWISLLAVRAEANHDLNSLAKVFYAQTTLLETCGDMDAARLAATRGLELAHATGERTLIDFCVGRLGEIAFLTGDLAEAARRGRQLLACEEGDSDAEQSDDAIPAYVLLGAGDVDTSVHLLQQTVKLETYSGSVPQQATLWLARAQRAAGLQSEAFTSARAGLLYGKPEMLGYPRMPLNRNVLAAFLTILDATTDDMAAFRAFCDDLRQNHPDVDDLHLCSWYLERSEPVSLPGLLLDERFDGDLPPGRWQWIDPTGRGACKVEDGLRIQGGEACDLWHLNRNAPRLLTSVAGDFAIQTTCTPATAGLPMGGLCLWGDADHFVRLDRGALGESEVSLMACIARRDHMIGRGRLPGDAMTLRLECQGRQVRGLCSADGETWWRVGECEWPWQGAAAAGPFVVGLIDRTLYPGAPPDGGALAFLDVQVWQA